MSHLNHLSCSKLLTSHIESLFLHCLGPTGTLMAPLCASWSPPSANSFQRMHLATRVQQSQAPPSPLLCHGTVTSRFLCPPMPKSFFKTLHAELMEKGNWPSSPKDHVCVSTLCCCDREDFIHFPALLPSSVSHWVLNHSGLWEMLGP